MTTEFICCAMLEMLFVNWRDIDRKETIIAIYEMVSGAESPVMLRFVSPLIAMTPPRKASTT